MTKTSRTYDRNSPEAAALQVLGIEREMKIPLARSRAVYSPAAVTA